MCRDPQSLLELLVVDQALEGPSNLIEDRLHQPFERIAFPRRPGIELDRRDHRLALVLRAGGLELGLDTTYQRGLAHAPAGLDPERERRRVVGVDDQRGEALGDSGKAERIGLDRRRPVAEQAKP